MKNADSATSKNWLKAALLISVASLCLACCSCGGGSSEPTPPPQPVTDTKPVGEGLKVIGYALLGGSVVVVLGRMLK